MVGPLKDESGKEVKEAKEVVECLNKTFANVFTKENEVLPTMSQKYLGHQKLEDISITEEKVLEKLKKLNASKAMDPG